MESLTVPELRRIAADLDIPWRGRRKPDLVAAIVARRRELPLLELPAEIQRETLDRMAPRDIARLCRTARFYRAFCGPQHDPYWRGRLGRDFALTRAYETPADFAAANALPNVRTWFDVYGALADAERATARDLAHRGFLEGTVLALQRFAAKHPPESELNLRLRSILLWEAMGSGSGPLTEYLLREVMPRNEGELYSEGLDPHSFIASISPVHNAFRRGHIAPWNAYVDYGGDYITGAERWALSSGSLGVFRQFANGSNPGISAFDDHFTPVLNAPAFFARAQKHVKKLPDEFITYFRGLFDKELTDTQRLAIPLALRAMTPEIRETLDLPGVVVRLMQKSWLLALYDCITSGSVPPTALAEGLYRLSERIIARREVSDKEATALLFVLQTFDLPARVRTDILARLEHQARLAPAQLRRFTALSTEPRDLKLTLPRRA